jgi:PAS domain S-box-containing protein
MVILTITTVRQFRATNAAIRHSTEAHSQLVGLFSLLKDIETSSRGHLLTGDERYLDAYQAGLAQFPRRYEEVRTFIADTPGLRGRLTALKPDLDAKLTKIARGLEVYQQEGMAAAAEVVASASSTQLMETIRTSFSALEEEEERIMEDRLNASELAGRRAVAAMGSGFALAVFFLGSSYYLMRRDQSARAIATATLERQNAEIADLYNHAPCGYHSLRADGMFLAINDTELTWLGYQREEVIDRKRFTDVLTPAGRATFAENFPRFMKEGRIEDIEFDLVRRDGTVLPVSLSATAIVDHAGHYICSRSTLFDLTARRRLAQVTNEARAYAESIVDTVPEPLIILTSDLRVKSANQAYYTIFETSAATTVGHPFSELGSGQWSDPALMAALLDIARQPAHLCDFEIHATFPKLGPKVMLINARQLGRANLAPPLILVAITDISARKAAEERVAQLLAQASDRASHLATTNQELEAFSYSVSHDLRAPLRHLSGYSQMLEKQASGTLDEKSRHYLRVIGQTAREMGVLIDELLAFSGIGRTRLQRECVSLDALVAEVRERLMLPLEGRHISWNVAPLPTIEGDPALLRQVFVNLLDNAVKYTRKCADAQIDISLIPGDGSETIIAIRDNGAGFEMKYANKLFGVFQRLHSAAEFEGNGIGLATVRRILQRHGGRIWAEAAPGVGATFYLSFPRTLPRDPSLV